MVANTWIAAAPGDWSDDANWSLGHSPIAGEDPTFDGTSVNNCNADDPTPTGVLTIAAGYSGTITQSSDMHITGYSQAGGTFTGVTTKWVYLSGNLTKTAGTITNDRLRLNLSNSVIDMTASTFYLVIFQGNNTIKSNFYSYSYYISPGSVVNIYDTKKMYIAYNSPSTFNNMGSIIGGDIHYLFWSTTSNTNIQNIGNFQGNLIFQQQNGGGSNILKISTDVDLKSIYVYSQHAIYTCTLDPNGHSLTATTITVGTRGILSNSASTDSVVSCANFDSSAGTFTPDRTVLVMEGASTLKLAAGGSVDNLISKGVTALASDAIVANVCAHVNPISKGAFALTLTKPENEYTGLRRPIIVPVKKSEFGPAGIADGWLRDLGAVVGC